MTALKGGTTDVVGRRLVSARNCIEMAHRFFHQRSSRTKNSYANQYGTTLWSLQAEGSNVQVFFDWVEVAPGVVAQSNPMGILSNVGLIGDDGQELARAQALLCLNTIVYLLPWQSAVVARLAQWRKADYKRDDYNDPGTPRRRSAAGAFQCARVLA